tara:strand:+ start:2126 stop:2899 length:774 start_codon:yes stop_codon:yes gene_type:complete
MITVISPAKKLSDECHAYKADHSQPTYLSRSAELVSKLKSYEPSYLQSLMGVSEKLSVLNWERYQSWNPSFSIDNSRQAFFMFKGDTYTGLDADSLSKDDLSFSQKHTRILSGLYGLLKPLDLIMPYRLEMGTKMENKFGKNLYDFWGDELVGGLEKDLADHESRFIVNCASVEYFKSIDKNSLSDMVITPTFKEIKNGKARIVSFFAKKARGMMARYIIKNKINDPREIVKFDLDGYEYNNDLSSVSEPVFTRAQA